MRLDEVVDSLSVECIDADALRTDKIWWRIYEEAFPTNEREHPEVILRSLLHGVGMAFRVQDQGVTCGLATIHLLRVPPAVFFVYLAVAREYRHVGMGRALFQDAWRTGAARLRAQGLRPLGLIWEVDPPQPDAEDAEIRLQRIAFFERQGGKLLDRPYVQPPVDGISAVPMRLMFRPAEGQRAPMPETIEDLVRAIYSEKYGAINGIDRTIRDDLLNRM